ncbi:BLI1 (YKL061W) [Zygosaccharomyces parabailii]|nr:BLI1 (YKL061W) [Zygosaccharomyces parabailii]CDH11709.1 probable Biogenesis of lysosome-related organelles complex 1 subunit BLI1 [Zygosaccharomyces bailii ISA1307]
MREQERTLHQDVEHCVEALQDYLNTELAKAVSVFSKKADENETWLEEIRAKFQLKDEDELQTIKTLREQSLTRLEVLENKVDYYEKLCDELEEFQNELEVKTKLEQNRRSRLGSVSRD